MIDVDKVYDPIIFTFNHSMIAYVVVNGLFKRVNYEISSRPDRIITSEGDFHITDVLVFRSFEEMYEYHRNGYPLKNKLCIIPIHQVEFVSDTLNNIILLDSKYWVSEFGCRNIEEVFKQHNYIDNNGYLAVQVGGNIADIPLSLNVPFDTLGKLNTVELARKVIDDIDDLCGW
jgi:hypothetical protein